MPALAAQRQTWRLAHPGTRFDSRRYEIHPLSHARAVERQLTIGPAGVQEKERKKFAARWAELTGEEMAPAA